MKKIVKREVLIIAVMGILSLALVILACVSSGPGSPADAESAGTGNPDTSASADSLPVKIIVPDKKQDLKDAAKGTRDVVSGSSVDGGGNNNPVAVNDSNNGNSYNEGNNDPYADDYADQEDYPNEGVDYSEQRIPDPVEAPQPQATNPPVPAQPQATPPPPVYANTLPDQPGDVWFVERDMTLAVGKKFQTNLRVNTGTQNLGAWGITITYDAAFINLDKSVGSNGIVAGDIGIAPVANTNTEGLIRITGFNTRGLSPNSGLLLYQINWVTKATGVARIDIRVDSLVDVEYAEIGTPRGFWSEVKVK